MSGRLSLSAVGAVAGVCLYALSELQGTDALPENAVLALTVLGVVFFGSTLAMSGPLPLVRAALGGALFGVVVAALTWLVSARFPTVGDTLDAGHPLIAMLVLSTLPLPFWIAANRSEWNDYSVLFGEAWAMAMRGAVALLFVAVVWALIFLSDAMLALVDLSIIEDLIEIGPVPWAVSGAVAGLALAVMAELEDILSPDIAIRFLRLVLPAVLVVVAVFVVALPVRGFPRIGGLSVGATLLAMVAVSATLISASVERDDLNQADGTVMSVSTRVLAILLPLPALMAVWSIWLRVSDTGWSPLRVAAATAAGLALAYGLAYATAAARGGPWADRIRRSNVGLAVVSVVVSALWLTPGLNAEAIAARNQVARFESGRIPVEELDLWSLSRWGMPGARAIAALEEIGARPGQEALAARLADKESWGLPAEGPDPSVARAELARLLPVSPAAAVADRAAVVSALEPWEVDAALDACRAVLSSGAPGCVLVVADFWPQHQGNEAALLSRSDGGWLRVDGFVPRSDGTWDRKGVLQGEGAAVPADQVESVILRLQSGPPVMRPTAMNSLQTGVVPITIIP